jgi:hypothetical protein
MNEDMLIEKIVREVMYRIETIENESAPPSEGAAVLLTSYVPGHRQAIEQIAAAFGDDVEYVSFCDTNVSSELHVKTTEVSEVGYDAVLNSVSSKEHIVLLSPNLSLLADIANGNDEQFAAYIAIRCMLWGKDVNVLLDFERPRFKRNTLYEKVADVLDALEGAGIRVMTYKAVVDPTADLLQLVTEKDIKTAYKTGMAAVKKAPRALVTPNAKDAARQLGVAID